MAGWMGDRLIPVRAGLPGALLPARAGRGGNGGSGGNGALLDYFEPQLPPPSPSPDDDEFTGDTLRPAWSWDTAPDAYQVGELESWLTVAQAGAKVSVLSKAFAPPGAFGVEAMLSFAPAGDGDACGLALLDAASATVYAGLLTASGDGLEAGALPLPWAVGPLRAWLRVERDAGDLYRLWFSGDATTWLLCHTSGAIATAVARLALAFECAGAGPAGYGVNYVRVYAPGG